MISFTSRTVAAIGEAMVELATVGGGLYRRGFAGDTFNTAWHLAQILPEGTKVKYVTRVGQDSLSSSFVDEMISDGLDTTGVSRDPERIMGLYLIELDGVERSFHYWRNDAAARLLADDPGAIYAAVETMGLIHLSGVTLAILSPSSRKSLFDALSNARKRGAVVAFDPNIRPRLWSSLDEVRDVLPMMLSLTDIALPSFDDEVAVWGDKTPTDTVERFMAAGVTEIVVKNGAASVTIGGRDGTHFIATPTVHGVRDTTGAGDGFNAGYLAARLMDKSCFQAVDAAQRLSAEVICHFGARIPRDIARGPKFSA